MKCNASTAYTGVSQPSEACPDEEAGASANDPAAEYWAGVSGEASKWWGSAKHLAADVFRPPHSKEPLQSDVVMAVGRYGDELIGDVLEAGRAGRQLLADVQNPELPAQQHPAWRTSAGHVPASSVEHFRAFDQAVQTAMATASRPAIEASGALAVGAVVAKPGLVAAGFMDHLPGVQLVKALDEGNYKVAGEESLKLLAMAGVSVAFAKIFFGGPKSIAEVDAMVAKELKTVEKLPAAKQALATENTLRWGQNVKLMGTRQGSIKFKSVAEIDEFVAAEVKLFETNPYGMSAKHMDRRMNMVREIEAAHKARLTAR